MKYVNLLIKEFLNKISKKLLKNEKFKFVSFFFFFFFCLRCTSVSRTWAICLTASRLSVRRDTQVQKCAKVLLGIDWDGSEIIYGHTPGRSKNFSVVITRRTHIFEKKVKKCFIHCHFSFRKKSAKFQQFSFNSFKIHFLCLKFHSIGFLIFDLLWFFNHFSWLIRILVHLSLIE